MSEHYLAAGKQNIAIVGAGISGLTAAHYLHHAGHRVTIFEANNYPGGHSNTVSVETAQGTCQVDTGFIVFNDNNYPNFENLLSDLNVSSQPANMSFSVFDHRSDFEWATRPFGFFATPERLVDRHFYRMLVDLARFNRELKSLVGSDSYHISLREFLEQGKYSQYFVDYFIVPQVSAIWSAEPAQLWSFPVVFLAEFFENHQISQLLHRPKWRTICGGSRSYVQALLKPFGKNLHLNANVSQVKRDDAGVEIMYGAGNVERFDHVVLATHADQTRALLIDPSGEEERVLAAFSYQPNEAILHTDKSLMPRRKRVWASWNYDLDTGSEDRATVTYHMNRLQSLKSKQDFFVTLNRSDVIDQHKVIGRFDYAHPVYTAESRRAQLCHADISGANRTHYCGAYWRWGFHEDGVWSALRVCQDIDPTSVPQTAIL